MPKKPQLCENERFETLIDRVSNGSDEAVWELLDRYSGNLRRAVRRHMPRRLQGKLDSEDVVQSVWKSFLRNRCRRSWIKSVDDLAAYLLGMARLKTIETHRRFTRLKAFDIRREVPVNTNESAGYEDRRREMPSQIVERRERWQQAVERAGEHGQAIVAMRLKGLTHLEIGERLGISRAKVHRILADLLESVTA